MAVLGHFFSFWGPFFENSEPQICFFIYQMWDEISQMTDICHKCTKNGIFKFDKKTKLSSLQSPPWSNLYNRSHLRAPPPPVITLNGVSCMSDIGCVVLRFQNLLWCVDKSWGKLCCGTSAVCWGAGETRGARRPERDWNLYISRVEGGLACCLNDNINFSSIKN